MKNFVKKMEKNLIIVLVPLLMEIAKEKERMIVVVKKIQMLHLRYVVQEKLFMLIVLKR